MSESICVTLEKFTRQVTAYKACNPIIPIEFGSCSLELKLSFDGNEHFIEEAWLDDTIDFYAIADKYGFLDKLLEEALAQLKLDKETSLKERGYIENLV
jgi:hypothetical protein